MKIGIITHYYNSKNYGGNLQAYALQTFLSQTHDVEQICFVSKAAKSKCKIKGTRSNNPFVFTRRVFSRLGDAVCKILQKGKQSRIEPSLKTRSEAIARFNRAIPHSEEVYDENTIATALERYDAFVTGSDQVWHPSAVNSAYLLQFVKGKRKISYAASLAVSTISPTYAETLRESLRDYRAVSVREKTGQALLQPLIEQPVQVTVDPVLLLEKEQWETVAGTRIIENGYVFCYFFGVNKRARSLATAYARARGLQVVTLPYLTERYRRCDEKWGDEPLFDVSPADFLSLIRYADCVFTDSFHATVFSYIFQKEFFVFQRKKNGKLSSRLTDVLSVFGATERFCDTKEKETLAYIQAVAPIEYLTESEALLRLKNQSKRFLNDALGG